MWLIDYVTKNSIPSSLAEKGSVKGACDGQVQVKASSDYRNLPIVAPYGIAYVPTAGENTVVVSANGENVCMGVVAPKEDLQPGELMLFSSGGASLVLKNDGGVYINGERFG